MTQPSVRTRFAPSPTGDLHLGNARTALFNWLFARHHAGHFIIRSEDTDRERHSEEALERQLADLRWLGLDRDGGPYRQSERLNRYQGLLDRLLAADLAYPCYCSREELAAARRRQAAAGQAPRYPGTCANLDAAARDRLRRQGRQPTLRFRVPRGERVGFDDLVHGAQATGTADIGDFVIARGDGSPAFLFANAVDDALMGVTHVLRGEDHLSNTPRQLLLLRALDLPVPAYGHFGLISGPDGKPLSKRADAGSLADLRATGYLPIALVNHLARVGCTGLPEKLASASELAAAFDIARVSRGTAQHDPRALDGWQRQALDALDAAAIWAWMESARSVDAPDLAAGEGIAFAAALRPNVLHPDEAWVWISRLLDPRAGLDADANRVIREAGSAFFATALDIDEGAPGTDFRAWAAAVGRATGLRGRALYGPLRAALTGATAGPELAAVVPLMPDQLVRARLAAARDRAGAAGRDARD